MDIQGGVRMTLHRPGPRVPRAQVRRRGPEHLGLLSAECRLEVGLYPIVTLEKQLPNMIGNLV